MRRPIALLMVAGMCCSMVLASAQPETKPQPTDPPPAPATPPPAAEAPKGIPVPDGPALSKKELGEGLIIEDIKIGDGYEVKDGNAAVVAHYHGTLRADPSKIFDSSFNRGEPAVFSLQNVIPGWTMGVPGMKVGGVRRLTIPAKLAYGDRSPTPDIPPNSDLVFVIELVDALY